MTEALANLPALPDVTWPQAFALLSLCLTVVALAAIVLWFLQWVIHFCFGSR